MVKKLLASAGDVKDGGQSLGQEESLGRGNGNLLQYSCLGESQGQRSLVGYSPWGHKESDMTEAT